MVPPVAHVIGVDALDRAGVWPHYSYMAIPKIKATYSLDVETVRELEKMARHWKVPKSEALRRAIRMAAGQAPTEAQEALRALDELQSSLALSPEAASRWEEQVGDERRATSARLED